ncbi:Claudin-18 [Acipenser ruthenus]|uniref:Claudin-18 n=1 Tax=Acipenser ruthenus TaxID=7906 RepID=A0A662YQA6_ACIRT|nr:Claudin-18 [Acipenser ruthenus]
MAATMCQVMGFILGLLGIAGVIASTVMDQWSTQDLYDNPVTSVYNYRGLWRSCVRQSSGFTECRPYFTILGLPANNNIHIGQKVIEQVDSYVYLGQELTAGHKNSRKLARRRRAAWVSYASIAEVVTNTADATLRAHMFNSTVLPAMLYGAETWSLTAADRQKLAVTERTLERRMVGVKKTDHVSNELLRKTSKVKNAVNQADQAKKRWAGHVARRSDGRWTRPVTE